MNKEGRELLINIMIRVIDYTGNSHFINRICNLEARKLVSYTNFEEISRVTELPIPFLKALFFVHVPDVFEEKQNVIDLISYKMSEFSDENP